MPVGRRGCIWGEGDFKAEDAFSGGVGERVLVEGEDDREGAAERDVLVTGKVRFGRVIRTFCCRLARRGVAVVECSS